MVTTSNDAADLSQREVRRVVGALFRDDCPETIHVTQELALRHQVRVMAAMPAPSFMN